MLLLLGVTLATAVALCVLTWRLTVLDRAVQQQRSRERLEQAADSGSSALLQQVARTGDRLRAILEGDAARREPVLHELAGSAGEATAVFAEGQTLKVVPNRHLRYFLDVPAGTAIPDEVFAAGEALEYGRHDYAAASRWFSDLANGSNGAVRAGALLRQARNEFRRNESSSALAAYAEMARLGSVTIEGEPAELVGRFVRLGMLSGTVLAAETSALVDDLESGRWPLSRTSYEYYRAGLARFTRVQATAPLWEDSIAALLDTSRQAGMESGERVIWVRDSQPVLLVWRSRAGAVAGLAVTGRKVAGEWLASTPGFTLGLETADRRSLIPIPAAGTRAERILAFAGAHWRLIASPTVPMLEHKGAESLLLMSLLLVIILVLAGSFAVIKAVSRELSVARLQTDFVSAVSHEFRSPLTTLRSMSEMLERGRVPTEERRQRYYGLMARETARLHRLVEDLLDFGRMDAGVRQYDLRSTDVSSLVSQTVLEFQEQYAASGVAIEVGEVPAIRVLADAEALRRALHNLLDNAVKYSPEGGKIRVDVRIGQGNVCISVEDHGMGIGPNELKRIFRKFERGEGAKAASIRGTGLGLAMVHAIMRAHRGSVQVESELHRGSTFTITMPCAGSAERGAAWRAS
jgi:signal transduction histidine kinase